MIYLKSIALLYNNHICGAGGRNRTNNRLITNQMLYHWATPAYRFRIASEFGAAGRNRTTDTGIFSPLLYRLSYRGIKSPVLIKTGKTIWRLGWGSNPRPPAWQAGALTNWATEPNFNIKLFWWAFTDLNRGQTGYEPVALTNWAKGPFLSQTTMVGVARLELTTPRTQTACATKLRYTPMFPCCRLTI